MRMTGVSTPFTSYTIPPHAPKPVQETWQELTRIGILYDDARDDLKDAKRAVVQAAAQDVKAAVAATTAGEELADPKEHEREAQEIVDRLEAMIPGLKASADEAGNRLAEAIAEHRDEWKATLAEKADELAAAYDEALAEARLALATFIPAQAGLAWVSNFDASLAKSGRFSQFAGGRSRVSGRRIGIQALRSQYDPSDLLTVAALATQPSAPKPAEPPSRRQKVTADA